MSGRAGVGAEAAALQALLTGYFSDSAELGGTELGAACAEVGEARRLSGWELDALL